MILTGLSNLQTIIIYMLHHVDTTGHDFIAAQSYEKRIQFNCTGGLNKFHLTNLIMIKSTNNLVLGQLLQQLHFQIGI